MDAEKTFRTKTGFCHILPDAIVLTRDGIVGNLATVAVGNSITGLLMKYALMAAVLGYFAFDGFSHGDKLRACFPAVLALWLLYGIGSSLNNSATPVIRRDKIASVKFINGIWGLTRARFEVLFADERSNIKKRLIILPGSLMGGKSEAEKALRLMTAEHLIANS